MAPQITLAAAREMARAAAAHAAAIDCRITTVIVDAGGHMLLLERDGGAPLCSLQIAERKARCALLYGAPTAQMADAVSHAPALIALPDMVAFGGGLPIRVDGRIAGAIAVSGALAHEDVACAEAGLAALNLTSAES